MNFENNILEHIYTHKPVLDNDNQFMYFSNNKVAQRSFVRNLLPHRVIVYKDNCEIYDFFFEDCVKKNIFNKLFKFTIVRNPWDRTVSAFHYLREGDYCQYISYNTTFEEFIHGIFQIKGYIIDVHFDPQTPKAFFQDQQFCQIFKLEHIANDWKIIAKNCQIVGRLPHIGKSMRSSNYRKYYTDQKMIDVVYNIYHEDIERFKYNF